MVVDEVVERRLVVNLVVIRDVVVVDVVGVLAVVLATIVVVFAGPEDVAGLVVDEVDEVDAAVVAGIVDAVVVAFVVGAGVVKGLRSGL